MTSKRCFFKVMREDFRHKTWMLALSILGNLLAVPVVFLLTVGVGNNIFDDMRNGSMSVSGLIREMGRIQEAFCIPLMAAGGFIAIAGALIVGLFGFRYVFHRNMVDTWHSVPVRRSTLFGAGWLNGLLIWLIPFLGNLAFTLVLAGIRMRTLKKEFMALSGITMTAEQRAAAEETLSGGRLLETAFWSAAALIVAFLLVYHLILLAVMLCGNILNTLVTSAALGAGVISGHVLILAFCSYYLETFVAEAAVSYRNTMYASPLASSVVLLFRRTMAFEGEEVSAFFTAVLVNLLIAAALGIFAWLVYLRRPSELAEQGLKNRPVRFSVQVLVSLVAAMGGWLLFSLISSAMRGSAGEVAWGIFGALLAGIVVFGILDIIFNMDFKAFFSHRVLMAATMAAALSVCFAFCWDWMGYDSYLPKKEDIAEIAVLDRSCANRYFDMDLFDEDHPLNRTHIGDAETAWALLEAAVDYGENGFPRDGKEYRSEHFETKITLKNGREYYRNYYVGSNNSDVLYALLTAPEYLDTAYRISMEELDKLKGLEIRRGGVYHAFPEEEDAAERRKAAEIIREAYNRDLEEHPEAFIGEGNRLLCTIYLNYDYNGSHYDNVGNRTLEVAEGMVNTKEALRELGLGEYTETVNAEEVAEIRIQLFCWYSDLDGDEDLAMLAADQYGVYPAELTGEREPSDGDMPAADTEQVYGHKGEEDELIAVRVTDREEIRELLNLFWYDSGSGRSGIFRPNLTGSLQLEDENGDTWEAVIPTGVLPEKYILRFGELK